MTHCPRCQRLLMTDYGDLYCLNCGTLSFQRRAWDLVSENKLRGRHGTPEKKVKERQKMTLDNALHAGGASHGGVQSGSWGQSQRLHTPLIRLASLNPHCA